MEWVEVQAKTVDDAVAMALEELGVDSSADVTVEVLQEPKVGFLGLGRQEALVKVTPKPKEPRKRRRRRRRRGKGETDEDRRKAPDRTKQRAGKTNAGAQKPSQERRASSNKRRKPKEPKPMKSEASDKPSVSIEEQAEVAKEFIGGLIEALGLEGRVDTRIDDDILFIDVSGDQTEALVGSKGVTMQALHELTRTVIQRKTYGAPRMRLDVAGYAERRREALGIYAGKLAARVKESGEEVMLEAMNAADRKVVHDAVVEIEGVISFSEGEEPHRAVVLAPDPDAPVPDPGTQSAGEADEAASEADTSVDADASDEAELSAESETASDPVNEAGAEHD
jgi:spoIIIJ-associated protein